MKLKFIHTTGARQGQEVVVSGGDTITVGRSPENDYVLDHAEDKSVSGFHAELRIDGNNLTITDKNSTNGVFVNKEKVSSVRVAAADTIQFGPAGAGLRVEHIPETGQTHAKTVAVDTSAEMPAKAPPPPLESDDEADDDAPTVANMPAMKEAPAPAESVENTDDEAPIEGGEEKAGTEADADSESKKYGAHTVGVMIQDAIKESEDKRISSSGGTSKDTAYFERMVETKVKKTSSKLKVIIALIVVGVILGSIILGIAIYRKRSSVTYQVNYGTTNKVADIASYNRYNVFMVSGVPKFGGSKLVGFCTAFSISQNLLVTNAHCIKSAQKKFRNTTVIMNGAPRNQYSVIQMVAHPGYRDDAITPDIGLLRINGKLNNWVKMAPASELAKIAPGVDMSTYGFPGRLNDEEAPEATIVKGAIGRITDFNRKLGTFDRNKLLQHSAFTTGGTSGSPLFDANGFVIGVNAGGYVERGEILRGYSFGMRIDLVNDLYPLMGIR